MRRTFALVALALALAAPAAADVPDWNAVADVGTVVIETFDEDGDARETTIWLAVVDGQGYIRTGGSTWGDNLVRKPECELEIEDEDYLMRVAFVEDDAERAVIEAAFNEKYGWSDTMIGWFRGGRPLIMRLEPR